MANSNSVLDFLLKPVPFLPRGSFLLKGDNLQPPRPSRPRPLQRLGRNGTGTPSLPARSPRTWILKGIVEPGTETPYAIMGEDFVIRSDTWIFGEVRLSANAIIHGINEGGVKFAKKIIIQDN